MRTETEEEMYEERVHSDLLDTEDETEEITKESWDDKGENEQKMTKTIEELLSRVSVFSFGKGGSKDRSCGGAVCCSCCCGGPCPSRSLFLA